MKSDNWKVLVVILCGMFIGLIIADQCFSAELTATWDPNTEDDLAGYKIYYGQASGQYDTIEDCGNVTTYTLDSLEFDQEYFVVVTAYDRSGNESPPSNEVSATTDSEQISRFDVNRDGTLNVQDILDWRLKRSQNPWTYYEVLDVNEDSTNTILDLVQLRLELAKKNQ